MLRPKILIVGKNLIKNRSLIAALKTKYQVDMIENYQAVEISLLEKINLVIIEILKLHPQDLQFLKTLKIKNPNIIIIAVVAEGNVENTSEIFYAGACDIFPEPIHYSLLIQRIESLLKTPKVT